MRKFAKDNGVNINEVPATGPKGTVTKEDVQNFMKPVLVDEPSEIQQVNNNST